MANENEDLDLIENADGSVSINEPGNEPLPDDDDDGEGHDEGGGEEPTARSADDSDDAGEGEDESPSKTELNRQRRLEKKQKIRDRNERIQRELAARDSLINEMSNRLAMMERRGQGADMAHIDNEMAKTADAYGFFKNQIAQAAGQPEAGAVVAEATEKMMLARDRYEQLKRIKGAVVQQQTRPSPIDPVVVNHAKTWAEKNPWYNPAGGDEDSAIAMAVDNQMAAEGWHPGTPEYWKELDRRLQRRLPERYKAGTKQPSSGTPRSVVTGSGRETGRSTGGGGYTLSAERVQALKDAGMWNDIKVRNDMILRYKEQDRQNGN